MQKIILILALFVSSCQKKGVPMSYQAQEISDQPKIVLLHDFLSSEECDHLIALGQPELVPSTVVDDESTETKRDTRRTSHGTFLTSHFADPVVQKINQRIAAATSIPEENGECFQILRYQMGQEYQPHFDTFDPATHGGKACFARGGQRIATILLYLNTPEKGGETIFPNARIKIKARRGLALLFYNTLPDGEVDNYSLHGGAPVISGEKWVATKWLRESPFN